jgi:rhamnosyltransferase
MNVSAIIVSYNPDFEKLKNLCSILLGQNIEVLLIDNSEPSTFEYSVPTNNFKHFKLNQNIGIAAAQNIGLKYLYKTNFDAVIFFDQDTIISSDYLSKMIENLNINEPLVLIPNCIDADDNFTIPSIQISTFIGYKKNDIKSEDRLIATDIAISSGMLVTSSAMKIVGQMDEDYFIDYVDTDWCLRCKFMGVPIYINQNVTIKHSIGSKNFKIGFLSFFVHPPIRCYYQIRNTFLLMQKKHVPFKIGLFEFVNTSLHYFFILFVVDQKIVYLKMFVLGIIHGIRQKKGKYKFN